MEDVIWVVEIRDTEAGPWRLMSSGGEPDTPVYALRSAEEAEETAGMFERARVVEFRRVTSGG